ncbi:DUF302 domain-containing protein [Sulfurimonas sp. SAG-AH-194-I05]|nr:DUF302 domain-containing protein [Sulfurimonas sp. SAG-AH-194-I05]MDF1874327.1 DUF302 domain-containing protein [Sulfurimonas sp. SAG-AH-194-I05]
MLKNILAMIGALVSVIVIIGAVMFGSQVSKLDSGALPAYMDMFGTVLETGNAAEAMILEYKVDEDVTNEDVAESIYALTEEANMRITGDIKMFTEENAKGTEVKHARIFSLCSLQIAKVFMNYSPHYGGFMPCRIMLIEFGNGDRILYTMDLTLMIHGGQPLSPKMLELATIVQASMTGIPARAAKGDF